MENYNYFSSDKSNAAFDLWADNSPESFSGFDRDRWVKLIYVLLTNGDSLERWHIEETKNATCQDLTDGMITIYMDQYESMKALYGMVANGLKIE